MNENVRSFIVNDQFTEVLRGLPEERFAGIMVHAFSQVFGLGWSEPQDPMDKAVAEAIATFADQFEFGRKAPRSGAERTAKYRAKKAAETAQKVTQRDAQVTQCDAQVTQCDAQVTQCDGDDERKKERKNICVPDVTRTRIEFPSVEQIVSFAAVHFSPVPPADFCEYFHRRMTECGWIDRNGRSLDRGRWQRELSAWWDQEKKNVSARAGQPAREQVTGSGRSNDRDFDIGEYRHVE